MVLFRLRPQAQETRYALRQRLSIWSRGLKDWATTSRRLYPFRLLHPEPLLHLMDLVIIQVFQLAHLPLLQDNSKSMPLSRHPWRMASRWAGVAARGRRLAWEGGVPGFSPLGGRALFPLPSLGGASGAGATSGNSCPAVAWPSWPWAEGS
jgi:hypothetical protein